MKNHNKENNLNSKKSGNKNASLVYFHLKIIDSKGNHTLVFRNRDFVKKDVVVSRIV